MVNPGLFSANKSTNSVKVSFRIPYFTQWGQSLLVCGSVPVLGSWNVKKGVLLSPVHQGAELIWGGSITVPKGFQCQYSYYVVDDNKNVLRWEMGKKRELVLREGIQSGQEIEFRDLWQTGSDALPFRSAFKDVIFRQSWDLSDATVGVNHINVEPEGEAILVQFKISCPNIEKDTSIYVIGSNTKLGQWKVENGLKLSYFGESVWKAECVMQRILLSSFIFVLNSNSTYRYGKYDRSGNFSIESGPNREVYANSPRNEAKYIFLSDGMMREIPWRGAGVAVPMFSVRSESDLGVGEFLDLKLLVDWAVASGFHLVQLLPINDTSVHGMWWDSYPYSNTASFSSPLITPVVLLLSTLSPLFSFSHSPQLRAAHVVSSFYSSTIDLGSLSVFALHPLYLRVQALSKNIPEEIKKEIEKAKQQLDGKDVDYEATMATKLSIAKKVFAQEKDLILNSSSFKEFFSENEGWLKPYAAFCFLRDFFETSDRTQWGCFAHYSEDKLEKLVSKDSLHYEIICFHYYVQYHLHLQLSEAAEYARKKGVILKGDLPIGVDRNSVDTWVYPNLFRMNTSTGAPPDYFDKNGQNWGFPTYNWEEMSKDNYGWWRARLTQMAKYFTAYRIDHILGFFRIWELPDHAATGLVGKFRPSIPLSQEELEREGIWDFNRLSYPYIKRELLQEKFGDAWTFVATTFLKEIDKNFYEFKEDCNTEKKIASKLKTCAESSLLLESVDKLQRNLFDLSQNIVLIRDPEDPRKFYPRFNLEDTISFQDLDDHSKNVLKRLYHDYYFCRQENLWRQNALKTLPVLLNSSDMLACGEDLGLIPSCVHPVMQELGLVGLRIQRMPNEPDLEFGIPSKYSYMTVCAPSCHDCSTLRAWWEEDEERRLRFFKNVMESDGLPPDQCVPEVAHFVIRQHFEAPSMWAIFPLQDLLALKEEYTTRPATEETINDPTNPKHYWRFRVHVTLESLIKDNDLQTTIKDLVGWSGRSLPKEDDSEIEASPVSVLSAAEALSEKQKFASTTEKPVLVK
ncbi:4-alpha-glucanotransferase DPE2 [Glycine soja]|uniref:4-alpha-glucanotransferase n=1 Tax=Glycine soja TaxID=3848 RepID=A0A0B2PMQ1_GLYSO|nr:4-alpha-glucanotransferase DPE2 [Glycine soja]